MPTIYDNIKKYLEEGLNKTLENAERADFCIGYFNLRGWQKVAKVVAGLPGGYLPTVFNFERAYQNQSFAKRE